MTKKTLALFGFALLLAAASPLYAQTGCIDSPENPTVVLALVGSAGAFTATLRGRLRARRAIKQR